MNQGMTILSGLGLGAGLMYLLDPNLGRRRRALLRDQLASVASRSSSGLDATWRDVQHRAQGFAAETAARVRGDQAPDHIVAERVRSKMGRYVSHAAAIDVSVRNGRVTLSGPILAREVNDLLAAVASVRGVRGVENRLIVHRQAGNLSSLQGQGRRPGERINLLEANWAPATRVLAGAAGGAVFAFSFTQRFPVACILGTAGLAVLARAATNLEMPRLLGAGGRHTIEVRKTLTIDGPVQRVFPFFARYDSFPRFLSHIREVRDLGDGRSHWVAEGPGGIPVRWDAVITRFEPNRLLAWRSEPGSIIANAGMVRFEALPDERTRIDIRLSYTPPGGALGHFAARLFGADPASLLDEDLVRLKSLIEEGVTSTPAGGEVSRQEVTGGAPQPAL